MGAAAPTTDRWIDGLTAVRLVGAATQTARPTLRLIRQDHERLQIGRSVIGTPLAIGSRRDLAHGLGTHSVSHIRIESAEPIARFSALVGVDHNPRTQGGMGSVVFRVSAGDRELYRSGVLRGGEEPERLAVEVASATSLDLHVDDAGDGPVCDHADWAEAVITTAGGRVFRLEDLASGDAESRSRIPFSFNYDGKGSDTLLDGWSVERKTVDLDRDRTAIQTTWLDPGSGLRVSHEAIRFADFPACEWVLYFENTGTKDTPIVEDVRALDIALRRPMSGEAPYRLHKTNGAPSNPTDFAASTVDIDAKHSEVMSGGGGRSSNKDFPFFKIETGRGSLIVAVGWSGQWRAEVSSPDGQTLRITTGLERTHFRLYPVEKVRSPRILVMGWEGDTLEANAQFRRLIYKHYTAPRDGRKPLPTLFCNTCFTRGGGWLNECNAGNQISLIRAYAPLGLEAVITDAGWFEGGWPAGAGNWTPRKDAYPEGMGPVADAAKAHGMVYGLWFEPERVVRGTWLHRNHPDWLLPAGPEPQDTYLLNFGLPEVQEYFFNIVKGFMELPGFRVYRQDFNMDPLAFWRYTEKADRQGIHEMKYIEGLYAYWDRIARAWPDSLREECASGGRRIDLETVRRMHIHQDSDYWFDNETDQAQIWGLSQYLPNNVFVSHLIRLDDYSFHSTLASSLCVGWIADAQDFDSARGKVLLERYTKVRHLLVGAWYPLLPYTRDPTAWMASQYHRPDLDEGLVLVFRRPQSPYQAAELALHALQSDASYELRYEGLDRAERVSGARLLRGFEIKLDRRPSSLMIHYRRMP